MPRFLFCLLCLAAALLTVVWSVLGVVHAAWGAYDSPGLLSALGLLVAVCLLVACHLSMRDNLRAVFVGWGLSLLYSAWTVAVFWGEKLHDYGAVWKLVVLAPAVYIPLHIGWVAVRKYRVR